MSTTDYRPLRCIIAGLLIVQASLGVCVQDGGLGQGTPSHERHDDAYVLTRVPDPILPGRELVTDSPLALAPPGVSGPDFDTLYESGTVPCADDLHLNLWRRRCTAPHRPR